MPTDDKKLPSLAADISEEAIEEALRAVERRAERASPSEGDEEAAALAGGDADAIDALRQEIDELSARIQQKDKLLEMLAQQGREATAQAQQAREWLVRQASDHENHKRRVERERKDLERFANEKLLVALFPVFDALERAVEHERRSGDEVAEGISMVRQQLVDTLATFGARPFHALGERFDPQLHEAVHVVRREDREANMVVEELACGFRLHERVVRPALVTVALPPEAERASGEGEEQGES